MAESDWLVVGLIIGLFAGVSIGWMIAQAIAKPSPASVMFTRDEQGRITEIHYVPLSVKS